MIRPLFQMSGDEARGLLFGLLEADKIQLRKYPDMPSMRDMIRDGKVRYDAYDPQEHWKTYKELSDEVAQNGTAYGDCEDLAVAVAAEDQVRYGVQSLPYAYTPREGLFHVVTAVPGSAVGSRQSAVGGMSDRRPSTADRQPGQVPFGYDGWPVAMGATAIPGYVLQDPSRAAGMGSFGYAPSMGSSMSSYGAYGADPRRRGGLFRQLGAPIREIGAGVKKGLGLESGWERRLGEELPGRLGVESPLGPRQSKEESAVKAIRKGMDSEARGEAPSPDEDDDLGDLEEEDDLGMDEEFGGLDDAVASEMFGGHGGGQRFKDDMFGEDDDLDLDDDEDLGGGGGGGGFRLPKLPSWALPATIGAALGAGAVGLGVALTGRKKNRDRTDSSSRLRRKGVSEEVPDEVASGYGDIGDLAASEMFGEDSFYLEDGERSEYGWDDDRYVDDLDNRTISIEEDYGSFAGISTLRRSELFGGDFRLVRDEDDEDDLLIED